MQPTDVLQVTRNEWYAIVKDVTSLSKTSKQNSMSGEEFIDSLKRLSNITKNGIPVYKLPEWANKTNSAQEIITNMKRDVEVLPDDNKLSSSFKAFSTNAFNFATSRTKTEWKVVLLFCSLMILGIWALKKMYNKWRGRRRYEAETIIVFDGRMLSESEAPNAIVNKAASAVPDALADFTNEPKDGFMGKLWSMLCNSIFGFSSSLDQIQKTDVQKGIQKHMDVMKQMNQ